MKYHLYALSSALLACPLFGDTITGRVVDSNGVGVAGLNINAKADSGGGDGNIMNDGTDAMGFFVTTIDPGTYRLTFRPPAPPAALGLVHRIDDQLVAGVVNLGTITLDPAVALTLHAQDSLGASVAGVNIDIIDEVTGNNIDLVDGTTDLLGNLSIAVPVGPIELRMDTTPVVGATLAPKHQFLDSSAGASLGNISLAPGFTVTAALLDAGFMGIENLDVDAIDLVTGEKLYTPGDNTDPNGFVDFVVPAGTYDMEFCPPTGSNFVAHLAKTVIVNANLSLGIITMLPGVRLSGTVTSHLGMQLPNIDLDVRLAGTSMSVLVCTDSTNASGDYSIVLASGNYDVTYTPSFSLNLGSITLQNVMVSAATTRDPVLPFCGSGAAVGSGKAGSGGIVPKIVATGGSLRLGNPGWGFHLSKGLGNAYGMYTLNLGANCAASSGAGVARPKVRTSPALIIGYFRLNGTSGLAGGGQTQIDLAIPNNISLAGQYLNINTQLVDPSARGGRSSSPMLCGQLCQ